MTSILVENGLNKTETAHFVLPPLAPAAAAFLLSKKVCYPSAYLSLM